MRDAKENSEKKIMAVCTPGDEKPKSRDPFARASLSGFKDPLKYFLMPLLGKNQFAITLHMYTSIGPNLDNTHRGQI